MDIQLSLSGVPTDNVSVSWKTVDDTALAGVDYIAASGVVTFSPGKQSSKISVNVLDRDTHNKRQFLIVLDNPVNAVISDDSATCSIIPVVLNGPLVKASLITNAYDMQNGRGGYFHYNSGTSEGQSIAIEGAFRASRVLRGGNAFEQTAADWFKLLGIAFLNAIGTGSLRGPILRQPFPTSADTITLLHWLFAAKGDVPGQAATYDYVGVVSGGKIIIPRADIYNVWMIYPTDATILYQSPYSPVYDASGNEVQVRITNWKAENGNTIITIPPGAPSKSQWKVVFGYNEGNIPQGQGFEAYPFWTPIADGYAACAPDTFRWFDIAIDEAMKAVTDPKWKMLRDALRKSAVRGQAITDLREVLKPLKGMPVFPPSGQQPDGMFCWPEYQEHCYLVKHQMQSVQSIWYCYPSGSVQHLL